MKPICVMTALALAGCGDKTAVEDVATAVAATHATAPYDPTAFDDLGDGWLKFYLQAQDALAHDRLEPARAALGRLARHAGPEAPQLLAAAAAGATDIEGVRREFRPLSAAIALGSGVPPGYGVVHCPMAFDYEGAYWIQKEGDIANPYFGASMLRCGAFKDLDRARPRLETEAGTRGLR